MALVRTQRSAPSLLTFGTNTQTTGSFTPSANSLLVIKIGFLQNVAANGIPNIAVSGGGLTYSLQVSGEVSPSSGDFYCRTRIYTAPVGGSPSSMTVTVDWLAGGGMGGDGGSPQRNTFGFEVEEWTGYNTGSPVGLTGSNGTLPTTSHSGTEHLSLGGTTASDSVTTGVLISDGDGGDSSGHPIGPDTGFSQGSTLAGDGSGASSDWWYFSSIYQTSPGAVTTTDWASWTRNWGHADAAIEIKAAAGGGTSITVPQGNLVLSPTAPTVAISNNISRTPPQGNLALSPTAPSLGLGMTTAQGNLVLSSVAPSVQVAPATALYYDIPILFPPIRFQLRQPFFIPATDIYTTVNLTIPQSNLALSSVGPILGYNIIVPQGNLALSPTPPVIVRSIPQGDLTISSVAPSLGFGLTPAQGNLVLSGTAPSIGISVPQGNLVLSPTAPNLGGATNITVPQGNLVISSVAPNVVQSITAGQLVLSPTAPSAVVGTNITPPQGNLALSSAAPNVVQSITAGQLAISTTAPSLGVSVPQGNLAISSVAPLASVGVTRQPPAGQLVLSTVAAALDYKITVPQGNLALSPTAPARVVDSARVPLQGNLVLSPTAPNVQWTDNHPITVPQGNLVIDSQPPQAGGNISRIPAAGQLALSPTAPAVTRIFVIVPAARDLTLSSVAPTVFATDPHPRTVPQGNLVLSTLPAQLVPGTYVYPSGGNLLLSTTAPSIIPGRTHHWRHSSTLLGNVKAGANLHGDVKQQTGLDGSVKQKTDLEAD